MLLFKGDFQKFDYRENTEKINVKTSDFKRKCSKKN